MKTFSDLLEQTTRELLPYDYVSGRYHTGYSGPTIDLGPEDYYYDHSSLSHEEQLEYLEKLFREENPTLLMQLRKAMSQGQYRFLLRQLAKGSFFSAAVFSNPVVMSLGISLSVLSKIHDRQKRKEDFMLSHFPA